MPIYSLTVQADTSATEDTITTLASLELADTLGHRARLRRVIVGAGGQTDSPVDQALKIQLRRSDTTGAGTSTSVNVNTIFKFDPLSIASKVSAVGVTYTAEPTTIDTEIGSGAGFNSRGQLVLAWEDGKGPIWIRDTTLLVQGEQSDATAVELTIYVEWEEF